MTTSSDSPDSPNHEPFEEEAEAKPAAEGETIKINDPSEMAQHMTTEQKERFLDNLMKKANERSRRQE